MRIASMRRPGGRHERARAVPRAASTRSTTQIAGLLGERFEICREVAVHKSARRDPDDAAGPGRGSSAPATSHRGAEVDLPADFTADLFDLLIDATCRAEDELMARAGGRSGRGREQTVSAAAARAADAAAPCRRSAGRSGRCPACERCRERYGDAFTLRILPLGRLGRPRDPADVKAVFTAGDEVGVALANPLLRAGARAALGDAARRTRPHAPAPADPARLPRRARSPATPR